MVQPVLVLSLSALFQSSGHTVPCLARIGRASRMDSCAYSRFYFIAATVLVNTWHGTLLLLVFEPLSIFRMESSLAWLVRAFTTVSWSLSWARQLATQSCAASLVGEHDHSGLSPESLGA